MQDLLVLLLQSLTQKKSNFAWVKAKLSCLAGWLSFALPQAKLLFFCVKDCSALSYLTIINSAILRKVTLVEYPWGPDDCFWALSCPEREIDLTIGLGDLDLVHFHTPHLNFEQREPKLFALQFALLSSSQNGLSIFTQRLKAAL